jgi:hypothetical protein
MYTSAINNKIIKPRNVDSKRQTTTPSILSEVNFAKKKYIYN